MTTMQEQVLNFGTDDNKVLLVDVDSKIPNLALMKISTHLKKQNKEVEFVKLGFNGYPSDREAKIINASDVGSVFVSNIFTVNQNKFAVEGCDKVDVGGVGSINPMLRLSDEIDNEDLDYSLYPDNDKNYGFITRGCNRLCTFCKVPKTEGKLYWDKSIKEITKYGFKKTSFMDNNILMKDGHKKILREILDLDLKCDFNQGLDFRCVDDENLEMLAAIKYISTYTFAFDFPQFERHITRQFKKIKKYIPGDWNTRVFIYHNPETHTLKETAMRINWCRDNGVLPYFMRDLNCFKPEIKQTYIMLAAWCNQPALFKKKTFMDFVIERSGKSISDNEKMGFNSELLKFL